MKSSRLAILAILAVGIAIAAATQTCRERQPAATTAESDPKVDPGGVAPRAADTPMDLRERDRLSEDQAAPAGAIATPDAPTGAEAQPPPRPREDTQPAEPAVVEGPPASPTIEAAMAAAKTAAQDEVAKARSEMRHKCWDKIDRGGVGDGGVKLGFSVSFNAEGKAIASAVQQGRESYIEGLDRCLAPFAHAIEVPAPGESVSVEVEVELP
jgi:hypothetical protein